MNISLSIQGLGHHTPPIGDLVLQSLADSDYHTFTCCVAFVGLSGINGIYNAINTSKAHIHTFNIIVGVDQKSTSKEALERLLSLGINAKVYRAPPRTFHPKIYLFEGHNKCKIIIGSSNLTTGGLYTNVEASLIIEFPSTDLEGVQLLNQIHAELSTLLNNGSQNLQVVTQQLIQDLFDAGIVPDRAEKSSLHRAKVAISSVKTPQAAQRIRAAFPTSRVTRPQNANTRISRGASRAVAVPNRPTPNVTATQPVPVSSARGLLVWQKSKLPRSDVLISIPGSNPTGGLRLTQAKFKVSGHVINQATYFRNTLFGRFVWRQISTRPFVEATTVPFDVTILGTHMGVWNLVVRHKPSGLAGQGNYTTSISWGQYGSNIHGANLIGKTLRLYEPAQGTSTFFIEIV